MDITDFKSLRESVKKFDVHQFSKSKLMENFNKEGLELDISKIFSTNDKEIITTINGDIVRAIIHITDITSWGEEDGLPRFHVYKCRTITSMIHNGKKERYRIAGKSDGSFYIIKGKKKGFKKLEICHHCWRLYNKKYREGVAKSNFKIKRLLI